MNSSRPTPPTSSNIIKILVQVSSQQLFCRILPGETDCYWYLLDLIRDRRHRFSDHFKGNRSWLICFNLLRIRTEIWTRSLMQLISSVKFSNFNSQKTIIIYQHIDLIYTMLYKVLSLITLTIKEKFYSFQGCLLEKKQ